MNFSLSSEGLIFLTQFKSVCYQDNLSNVWYISNEGIDCFKKNLGVLNSIDIPTVDLLNLITNRYKQYFEFTFENLELEFFNTWSRLEIHIYDDKKRNHSNNVHRFLSHLNLEYTFDQDKQVYCVTKFPSITTQYDMYCFINQHISKELNALFQPEHVAHCFLNVEDLASFKNFDNKLDFLEKLRFKKQLQDKFPPKNSSSSKKI